MALTPEHPRFSWQPAVSPCLPGYLTSVRFPDMLARRTPLYGWVVAALDLGRDSYVALPGFHVAS